MEHTIATDPKEIKYIKKDAEKRFVKNCVFIYAGYFQLKKFNKCMYI